MYKLCNDYQKLTLMRAVLNVLTSATPTMSLTFNRRIVSVLAAKQEMVLKMVLN